MHKNKIVRVWDWALMIFGLMILFMVILLFNENKTFGWDSWIWSIIGVAIIFYEGRKFLKEFRQDRERDELENKMIRLTKFERINRIVLVIGVISAVVMLILRNIQDTTQGSLEAGNTIVNIIVVLCFGYLAIVLMIELFKFRKSRFKPLFKKLFYYFVSLNFIGLVILNYFGAIYIYNTYITKENGFNICTFGVPEATQSVVKISGEYGTGTGFWVTPELILTNNHVVFENPRNVIINNQKYEAKVVSSDTLRDLALVQLIGSGGLQGAPLKFRDNPLRVAEDVYAVGFPADLDNISISKGIVSSIQKDPYDDRVYVQTDSAINPGNSGGPLLDYCGRVVGINTSSLLRNQNISFAIKYDQAKKVVDDMIKQKKPPFTDLFADNYPATPEEVVASYYNTLAYGIFDKAYDRYFSIGRKGELPRDNWVKGISVTWSIRLKSVEKSDQENVVKVRFYSAEFRDYQMTDSEFEGTWTLVKEKGQWKMDESNIKKIENSPEAE